MPPSTTAGLTLRHSSGQTEGQITRLKLVKRQGYGRATHEMLTWLESHAQPLIRVDGLTNGSTILWSVPWVDLEAGASLRIGESD